MTIGDVEVVCSKLKEAVVEFKRYKKSMEDLYELEGYVNDVEHAIDQMKMKKPGSEEWEEKQSELESSANDLSEAVKNIL